MTMKHVTIHRCDPEKIIIVDQQPKSEEDFQRLHQYLVCYLDESYGELTEHSKVVTLRKWGHDYEIWRSYIFGSSNDDSVIATSEIFRV